MTRARQGRRPPDRRRGEHGLTLIELLLGLALLALLASFIAGGLVFARRAFLLDRTADLRPEVDAAMETLSDLLASAVPLKTKGEKGGADTVIYDGAPHGVSFVGLGTGHALRGGFHIITVRVIDGDLVADITPTQAGAKAESENGMRRVVLLSKTRHVDFSYFGSLDKKSSQAWRTDWSKAKALPFQIACNLAFENDRRPPPPLFVTLRQRE